ncbi:hypothetical protein I6F19_32805, partial [Ensifer sp. BRP08]|nr:hypothetical protein [Ensifer sp. BRP08]
KMLLAWKAQGIMTLAGYILGFPADTPETIRRDIAIIQHELPVRFHLITASDLAGTDKIAALIESSIEAKDDKQFEESFAQMTAECNNCHKAAGKPFLHVGAPKVPPPCSNKMLGPALRIDTCPDNRQAHAGRQRRRHVSAFAAASS